MSKRNQIFDIPEEQLAAEIDRAFHEMPRKVPSSVTMGDEGMRVLKVCREFNKPRVPVFNHEKNKLEFL